jgi:hypothetical protein
MVGPVFALEMLHDRRRGRWSRLLPWVYAAFLGLQTVFALGTLVIEGGQPSGPDAFDMPLLSRRIGALVAQHFAVLLLLTPALTATAFSEEKAKRTLEDLFTTALTSADILLGKYLARSLRALEVLLAGLPVLCAAGASAGLPLLFFVALLIVTVLMVLGVSALGMVAAVESKSPSGPVLATYVLLGGGALAVGRFPVPALDPFHTLAPGWDHAGGAAVARRLLEAALAWGTLIVACLALAVWRLRPDGLAQLEGGAPRRLALAPARPPVGDDPVRWKEYHIEGLALLPMLRRVPRWLGVFVVLVLATGATYYSALRSTARRGPVPDPWPYLAQAFLFLFIAALVVAARCAGAVTGERERQTWESLRLTPLDGTTFLQGKLRGILDAVLPYYAAYAVPAFCLSAVGGIGGMLATGFGLVMAWPVMYYAAACGLRASVFGRSTWRSLVAGLMAVYFIGTAVCFAVALGSGMVLGCLSGILLSGDQFRPLEGVFVVLVVLAVLLCCALALVALARVTMQQAAARGLSEPRALPLELNVHRARP